MALLDVFGGSAFSTITLTDAVNKMPFVPGRAGSLGIFEEFGVPTTTIMVEEKEGTLSLIPTTLRGAPATQHVTDKRAARSLAIPHLAEEDTVLPNEVQDVREFGQENQLQAVQGVVNQRLREMTSKLDATLEHLRIGALKGTILDADGSSVIFNLFTEFGVTQITEKDFTFDTASDGDVRTMCHAITRETEDELGSKTYDHIHSFCSSAFFDDLVAHSEVRAAYERWANTNAEIMASIGSRGAGGASGQAGDWLRLGLARRAFPYAGIMFEEYRGTVGGVAFIPADKAIFFPVGVPGLYRNPFAPADFVEAVNTIGLPRYAKQAVDAEFARWVKLHLQSNPLPICLIPRVLQIARRT